MKVVWDLGEATVGQVQFEMNRLRPFAYTTIMTLLDRLAKKGAVNRRKQGRGYIYAPVLNRDAEVNLVLQRLIQNFFNGSAEMLLAYLLLGREADAAASMQAAEPQPALP